MCGIFGYIGNKNAAEVCLSGLKKLEYRGYDSSGIAGIESGKIFVCKEIGKISNLEESLNLNTLKLQATIAHTRWATHGKPSKENAHPHLDEHKTLAVVHNGVIENYAPLRDELINQHRISFFSETDTEVIAQMIAHLYKGDMLDAVFAAFNRFEGSFAVAMIHKDHPDQMVAIAQESPLVIGYSLKTKENFIASDPNALVGQDLDIYFLSNKEMALLENGKEPKFFDRNKKAISKIPSHQNLQESALAKGEFKHFMLKEIFEQEKTIRQAMLNRYDEKNRTAVFQEFGFDPNELKEIENIVIIACGTSWHAAYIAAYLFEEIAKIPAKAEIASEYRYKHPILPKKSLILVLSQSGETADTLAAMRNVRTKESKVIALCNVPGSTLAREADATIFLNAGPEVAVASTKTFTSQLTILYLFTLMLARLRYLDKDEGRDFFKYLYELPEHVAQVLNKADEIETLAKKYAHFEDFFFLGRNLLYPTALEGALKLKEVAYINAQGYPAGEMKHGPIALLTPKVPAVIFCANRELQPKIMSNLMECKARLAPVIVFGWKEFEKEILPVADDVVWIPKTCDALAPIVITIATQLFAYYCAYKRNCEIDQPRNLAKSVTVE